MNDAPVLVSTQAATLPVFSPAADATIVPRYVDGIVLTVRAGAPHRDAALRARVIGLVLTDAPTEGQPYAQGYRVYARTGQAGAARG